MAEGLFRAALARAGVEATVHSAGLVTQGQEASAHGVSAMERRGIDIAAHRSRRLTTYHVEQADLIVGMELQHVREAAVLAPGAMHRCFTLPELARRLVAIGPQPDDEPLDDYLRRAAAGRTTRDLLGNRPDDEVADPYGSSARDYERTAVEIEGHVATVVRHLHPSSPDASSPPPSRDTAPGGTTCASPSAPTTPASS